jgi:methylenetetrahydrofolate dehydrogenase (NADP+) / methenyltetrahydrofolate cyclohydrolase
MTGTIIDGKLFAEKLRARIADHVKALKEHHNLVPGLAVIIVGEDPASQVYVRNKATQTLTLLWQPLVAQEWCKEIGSNQVLP